MKKTFLILSLVLTSALVFGQFTIGPKVGYNASKLSTNLDTVKSNFRSGFQFGVFARIGKRVYVQPELYYTTQGGVFESNLNNWKQTVKLGSLDVPVLVGFKLINNDNLNLRILAGPMASFVVNKTVADTPGGITGPIEDADINDINWAIQAGAGIDLWFLTFDIRYQIGLNNLIKEINTQSVSSKNSVWLLSLGWKIL
ncbi:MAG: porin family protein [bacterium]